MTDIQSSKSTVSFFKSILIAMILGITISPMILLLTEANISWVLRASLLWTVGSALIFHPFIIYIYPHLMSKVSVYMLTSILIVIAIWFNITVITLLLPYDYVYYAMFNATLTQISLWGSIYLISLNTLISNFILMNAIDFYKEERLF